MPFGRPGIHPDDFRRTYGKPGVNYADVPLAFHPDAVAETPDKGESITRPALIEAACEAEEHFSLDELEDFTKNARAAQ